MGILVDDNGIDDRVTTVGGIKRIPIGTASRIDLTEDGLAVSATECNDRIFARKRLDGQEEHMHTITTELRLSADIVLSGVV